MADMKISNTMVNDTSSNIIAYAEQLKDKLLNWSDYNKVPDAFKTEVNKFQGKLNDFFLRHYDEWRHFLEDKDLEDETINTWKELEEFLEGITDSESMELMNIIRDIQLSSGQLNVRMSEDIPGSLEAVTTTDFMDIDNSYMDEETGALNIVYNFE